MTKVLCCFFNSHLVLVLLGGYIEADFKVIASLREYVLGRGETVANLLDQLIGKVPISITHQRDHAVRKVIFHCLRYVGQLWVNLGDKYYF